MIDVHAHAVLPMSLGAAGAAGPELGTDADGTPFYRVGDYVLRGVRYEGSPFMDVDVRLAAMDAAGIDRPTALPQPDHLLRAAGAGGRLGTRGRTTTPSPRSSRAHPGRLLGAAQLPMQDLDAAIAELERAVRELGLSAPYIDTDPGRTLDDPAMDDFYAAVVDLDVPLFVHPSPLGQRRAGRRSPAAPVRPGPAASASPTTRPWPWPRWCSAACWSATPGWTSASRTAAARWPTSPGGSPARRRRRGPGCPSSCSEHGVEHYLRRLWLDTHVHSDGSLELLAQVAGTDRLVFGTNFAGWDAGGAHAVAEVAALAPTLSANAARLLRLGRR